MLIQKLKDLIKQKQDEIDALRAEFDFYHDHNDVQIQIDVSLKITETLQQLSQLQRVLEMVEGKKK